MAEPIKTETPQNQQDSSLPLSNLQIKAILFAIFFVSLPLLASQAPDFVKQALSNKIWELFHLLLVGIAVAYGLFSRKGSDQEIEKVNANEPDNPQSYISDMLEGLPVFDPNEPNNLNVQSWSSMYNPNEPLVVVENEIMDGNAQKINKPLYLPIRSLNPTARQPALHESDELFQNDGDAEAPDSANEEKKGDDFKPSSNTNLGCSKNKSFRSLSAKQPNTGRKITPQNFKCEQNSFSSIGVKTVRSKSSNAMDELIKTLEESENEESFNEEEEEEEDELSNSSSCVTEDGTDENEVDKKADEFIAKFREQIRQQRMQCRRRPTGRKGGGK
ncbi:hypothetical protein LUZ62_024227 [Rhynchospora pubera]|uniref:Uncharacterized protein n=1 Tax=Rhynchospora pubera TaxID=906938 RepID=A0AAV8H8F7_9POAL|nr:hypothetical protein LUZ62_024227 [Rhynchospora pubera]